MNTADIITLILLVLAVTCAVIKTKHNGCSSCAQCENKCCKRRK